MTACSLLLASSFALTVPPASVVSQDAVPIVLRVYLVADVETETVQRAHPLLRAILVRAGFQMEWRECSREPGPPACAGPLGASELVVRILPSRPDPASRACGESIRPKGGGPGRLLTVYWDCIRDGGGCLHTDGGDCRHADPAIVLAHTIAHEIGHLLLPDARHTASGVMRATLGPMDWQRASRGGLQFGQTELKLMKDALARPSRPAVPDGPREPPERLVVRGPDATVIGTAEGDARSVRIDPALDRLLQTPGAHLTLTHNHVTSTSLSGADLGQLAKPGVDAVEAVGSDGSEYRAVVGPQYDAARFEDVVYPATSREIERQLRQALSQTPRTDIDAHFSHLVAIALDKAAVISYEATLSANRAQTYKRNQIAFGRATEAAAAAITRELKAMRNRRADISKL